MSQSVLWAGLRVWEDANWGRRDGWREKRKGDRWRVQSGGRVTLSMRDGEGNGGSENRWVLQTAWKGENGNHKIESKERKMNGGITRVRDGERGWMERNDKGGRVNGERWPGEKTAKTNGCGWSSVGEDKTGRAKRTPKIIWRGYNKCDRRPENETKVTGNEEWMRYGFK